MSWVIFDTESGRIINCTKDYYISEPTYATRGGANRSAVAYIKRKLARHFSGGAEDSSWLRDAREAADKWDIVTLEEYNAKHRRTKIVQNLMTGKDVEIDVNTPRSCDPSSELYWSM